jgi:mannose-6-phosphate isomerase-like protein (cupin superfamily)
MSDRTRRNTMEIEDDTASRLQEIRNINEVLKSACTDAAAGISIGRLAGDGTISLFAAEIAEGKPLRPHYHSRGIEIYMILWGSGVMKTGKVGDGGVTWTGERIVGEGDCFAIPEGTAHRLINTGPGTLRALFCCPADHLDGDRHFLE